MNALVDRASRSLLVGLLLALLLSGAFAACGAPPPVAPTHGAVYGIADSPQGGASLVALRGSDGAVLWRTPIPLDSESAIASVTATPSLVYVVSGGEPSSGDWSLKAIHADTGKVAWSFATGSLISGFQVLGDTVYLGSLYGGGVRALRASDGHLLWQRNRGVAALALAGDTLYAALTSVDASADMVVALQASDGTERWHAQVGETPGQMVIDQANLYVTTTSEVIALQVSNGAQLWRSPAVDSVLNGAAGNVYLSQVDPQTARLVALGASDGRLLWQHAILRNWFPFPLITASAVYVTASTDSLCALRPGDGSTAWCYQAHQVAPLAANDQTVYISDTSGALCALRAGDGSHQWCQHQAASSLVTGADWLALATPDGSICAVKAASGAQAWCQHVAQSVFDLTVDVSVGL